MQAAQVQILDSDSGLGLDWDLERSCQKNTLCSCWSKNNQNTNIPEIETVSFLRNLKLSTRKWNFLNVINCDDKFPKNFHKIQIQEY